MNVFTVAESYDVSIIMIYIFYIHMMKLSYKNYEISYQKIRASLLNRLKTLDLEHVSLFSFPLHPC